MSWHAEVKVVKSGGIEHDEVLDLDRVVHAFDTPSNSLSAVRRTTVRLADGTDVQLTAGYGEVKDMLLAPDADGGEVEGLLRRAEEELHRYAMLLGHPSMGPPHNEAAVRVRLLADRPLRAAQAGKWHRT